MLKVNNNQVETQKKTIFDFKSKLLNFLQIHTKRIANNDNKRQIEIELKIQRIDSNKQQVTGVSKDLFLKIHNDALALASTKNAKNAEAPAKSAEKPAFQFEIVAVDQKTTDRFYYNEKIHDSKRITFDENGKRIDGTTIKKDRLGKVQLNTKSARFVCVASMEIPINKNELESGLGGSEDLPTPSSYSMQRIKTRNSFQYSASGIPLFHLDLTTATLESNSSTKQSYEVEIEFLDPFLENEYLYEHLMILLKLLKLT